MLIYLVNRRLPFRIAEFKVAKLLSEDEPAPQDLKRTILAL
jgi:hypothetical protein